MVYFNETPENVSRNNLAERAAQGVRKLGAGVVKVVHRCNDAKETKILDLSSCSLTQVPDAVYFLMKASEGNDNIHDTKTFILIIFALQRILILKNKIRTHFIRRMRFKSAIFPAT